MKNAKPSLIPPPPPNPPSRPATPSDYEGENEPDWIRVSDAVKRFSIGRSTLYLLIKSNQIKSCSLRRRGMLRGIRLLSCDSIKKALEQAANVEAVQNLKESHP